MIFLLAKAPAFFRNLVDVKMKQMLARENLNKLGEKRHDLNLALSILWSVLPV